MVQIRPFRGVRPPAELAEKVAALPYDVVNSQEAEQLAAENPYSFFHIDKAEIDLPETIDPYDEQVYQKAAENFADFRRKNWLIKEEQPVFYLYQLTMGTRSQTGLVVCTSIEDYLAKKIKKHEYTRPEKELDRIRHIEACDANTSPIFLSYRKETAIQSIIDQWQAAHAPLYDFTSFHEVTHTVWLMDDQKTIDELVGLFADVPALYIADGHHRTESAVKVGKEKKGSSLESDIFLSIIFPDDQLAIWEYNRVLKVTIPDDFLSQLQENFVVEKSEKVKPEKPGEFQLFWESEWYRLAIKPEKIPASVVESLDVSLLQTYVFENIFGIQDVRTDPRIDFIGGIRGSEELERLVKQEEWNLAFSLYPTAMKDLLAVADANEIMPPKSTWFEPKLLSGLFLHELETR
ncbi:DUF1015 domain-containing protein [Enterococcus sp. JM9B]|uniref:DUF1015 domain-containing protein n=1 Tax=Enterococcus sp. JM9B TaxID=1857216 RepID=UPI0013752D40|nr:DUF1015 family protein [Enterococcus sp. JM9B]KAF1303404.1 hypothetical protein BAU16_04960 [Enterococcus sp. JM9B]